jgi:hypothetical protein
VVKNVLHFCSVHNAVVAHSVPNTVYLDYGLVMVDKKLCPPILLTSHHWIFFHGELLNHFIPDVPTAPDY